MRPSEADGPVVAQRRLDPVQTQAPFSILLVDDDPTTIRILSHILRDFGPARFATSGRVALRLARESVPDLVLLDVEMPDLNGFEVCKTFKSEPSLAQVPIIFISSHESQQLETFGLQLGASDFISKPVRAPILLSRVRLYQHLKTLTDTLSNTLRSAVTMDFMTGTVNRRELERTLSQECMRSQTSGAPVVLLLAEIDNFAAYNAEFGEEMGDACLRSVADALRVAAIRTNDTLARYSESTFALLLPGVGCGDARKCAQRAVDAVDALRIQAPTCTGHVTLSLGGSWDATILSDDWGATPPRGSHPQKSCLATPATLITTAEQALKCARAAGGHQISCADIVTPTAAPL